MNIQFLYFEGCPNSETAYIRLEESVSELVSDSVMEEEAKKYNFHG